MPFYYLPIQVQRPGTYFIRFVDEAAALIFHLIPIKDGNFFQMLRN
jgi:hypothetical protein